MMGEDHQWVRDMGVGVDKGMGMRHRDNVPLATDTDIKMGDRWSREKSEEKKRDGVGRLGKQESGG